MWHCIVICVHTLFILFEHHPLGYFQYHMVFARLYREADKILVFGLSWPENTSGGQRQSNMDWPKPKKVPGPDPKRVVEAKAKKNRGDHITSGGLRLPLTMWCFIMWSPIVFSAFAPPCFFGFWPTLFFRLWPTHVFSAFGPHCISVHLFYRPPCSIYNRHVVIGGMIGMIGPNHPTN